MSLADGHLKIVALPRDVLKIFDLPEVPALHTLADWIINFTKTKNQSSKTNDLTCLLLNVSITAILI